MRFSYAESMTDPSFYAPLARAAEEAGYHSMVIPDSICYPRDADSTYPYNPDGSREFLEDKPFLEPFSLIPALGAVTSRLRFTTFVVKVPVRNPVLLAKQVTSTAVLTGNRLSLGVGTSPWREDYDVLGVDWAGRGRRLDESIAILRGLAGGDYFEFQGKTYDPARRQDRAGAHRAGPGADRRSLGRRAAPGRPAGRRLDARRGRPGGPAPAARPPRRVPPRRRRAAGDATFRNPRDLHGRLHRRRRPPAGRTGRDRRDRRLPLALRDRPGHRAAQQQARPPAPLRRRRHREN